MKLEEGQAVLEFLSSRSILTASPDPCSDRFADLVFFLVQHCGQLDLDTKCRLVNENMMSKVRNAEFSCICFLQSLTDRVANESV
ncbi:hypothetical protein SAY86_025690 [Trapa natans]|uniref:Uncharacterized protein n=1 Tax=Trapa natans TaxID=22666 RepID=A0AAN7QGT2_TRANT|nr:hypothetical protein SAY86_025690 [Trapa natans]